MKQILKIIGITFLLAFVVISCNNEKDKKQHFLKDATYRQQVHNQFLKRQNEARHRSEALFSVFEKSSLGLEQREALEFLYAYMPLSDLADYDGEFFLKQVEAAFAARDYFSWGQTIPEDIFRHFVLVYRVNNEYLDTARLAFFGELRDRVKDLSMMEAALEVNHWCHEKVTYRATDGRTSAPLALVKTSWGRCGEESTFTVTALRAVGIPARQCYTPRWVHTNDNHAWVEVWIDGNWRYLGACEPEAELDAAWFTAPAKRAMMVHTNVFGLYNGPEEKNKETPLYSIINLLENYAPTRKVNVKVIDQQGNPVDGADVQFKVYNYAELYPITRTKTNAEGETSLISGMGDLMIWANKADLYGYIKSTKNDELVTVVLDRTPNVVYQEIFTMEPPVEQRIQELDPDKVAVNNLRLLEEDSIRNAYMSTFAGKAFAFDFSASLHLEGENTWKFLEMAQGNWREIAHFIQAHKDNPYLFPFLGSLLEKDLRDTPTEYLSDHLRKKETLEVDAQLPDDIIVKYILSPRILLESIKPWRSFFRQSAIAKEIAGERHDIQSIIKYVKENIQINDAENYYNCSLTPQGVYELKIADRRSRNIFFVAVCRSLNIPARIETATGKPQYYENGAWIDVVFETADNETVTQPKASLTIFNDPSNIINPDYYIHYTLAFFKDGDFQTLDYENDPAVAKFPYRLDLDEGYYRLMAGSRANDGSVTISVEYFEIRSEKSQIITIKLPEVVGKLVVRGSIDMNSVVVLEDGSKKSLKNLDNGKGLMLCFIDPGKEPSKHLLQDMPAQKKALEAWGGGILIMTPEDKLSGVFDASVFKDLPKQIVWGIDHERTLLNNVSDVLQLDFKNNFPMTIYLSTNGGILYDTEGYKIGIGEEVLKTISLEKESLK
ncbi:MAG: transglutaminase-like domain-containing protein [Bacteroidales bacterium]|jgi:transglutaminase-like putative cysteine protease|nr:transglutaminase-like domain-containing protein [Bacteroidales bacterium]